MGDDGTPRWAPPQGWSAVLDEWAGIEAKVRLKAALLCAGRRGWRRSQGAPLIGLTVDDLVNEAWARLCRGSPPWRPDRKSLLHYFFRRMEDEAKRICRLHENEKAQHFRIHNDDKNCDDPNVILLDRYRWDGPRGEEVVLTRHFLRWLRVERGGLVALAELMLLRGVETPHEQSVEMNLPVQRVYELRSQLKKALDDFENIGVQQGGNAP